MESSPGQLGRWWKRTVGKILIVASLIVASQTSHAQGVKNEACYGETVEAVLVNQMTGEPKVPLHIPIAAHPVVYSAQLGGVGSDPAYSCVAEPILADSVYFSIGHLRELSATLGFSSEEPTVRRFQLTYGRPLSRSSEEWKAAGAAEASSDGFTKLSGGPDAGKYVASNGYEEPAGGPLKVECFPAVMSGAECNVTYWLPGDVTLNYWFKTDNAPQPQWIALDRAMRRVVTEMIDRQYIEHWHQAGGTEQ